MKLAISFGLALLLVVAGAAHSFWSDDDTNKIASADKHSSTETLSEATESWNDDRLIGSLPLVSAVTFNDSSPIPSLCVSEQSVELNSIRDNSRIYKLNSRFQI
jgi:hypothetical protein